MFAQIHNRSLFFLFVSFFAIVKIINKIKEKMRLMTLNMNKIICKNYFVLEKMLIFAPRKAICFTILCKRNPKRLKNGNVKREIR